MKSKLLSKTGIRGKFISLSLFFLALMFVNYQVSKRLIDRKKDDEKVISLASRQEVLIESYLKSFFFFMETKKIKNVTDVVREFESNSKVLGGTLEDKKKETTQAEKPKKVKKSVVTKKVLNVSNMTGELALTKLKDIDKDWSELKARAIGLLGVSVEKKKKGYEEIVSCADKLTKKSI